MGKIARPKVRRFRGPLTEVPAGKPAQLTYHASAKKDCTPAPLPVVKVVEPPKAGALIVRQGMLTTDKFPGCEKIKVPAQVIFYQSKDGYTGPDHVSYLVTAPSGEVASYDVTITVKPAPPSTPTRKQRGTPI